MNSIYVYIAVLLREDTPTVVPYTAELLMIYGM